MNMEAFIDFFNMFNQQAALLVDDNYTYELRGADRQRHAVRPPVRQEHRRRADQHEPNYGRPAALPAARSAPASASV